MIEIRNLKFGYKDKNILNGISFSIKKGDTLSILGANGSGKSTLLRIMLGFLKFEGTVNICGKSVRNYEKKELARLIAYVPQTHAPSYEYSVFDIVLMGALCRTSLFSNFSLADKKLAEYALERMGILELKDELYTRISGGQRQLSYIARTLVQGAKVIKTLKDDGYTFVQTTHYPRHAKFVSNLVLFLKDGKILDFGKCDELINPSNIDKIYGIDYEKYEDKL